MELRLPGCKHVFSLGNFLSLVLKATLVLSWQRMGFSASRWIEEMSGVRASPLQLDPDYSRVKREDQEGRLALLFLPTLGIKPVFAHLLFYSFSRNSHRGFEPVSGGSSRVSDKGGKKEKILDPKELTICPMAATSRNNHSKSRPQTEGYPFTLPTCVC